MYFTKTNEVMPTEHDMSTLVHTWHNTNAYECE